MIGHIENFHPDTQTGTIKNETETYTFHLDDWVAQVPPDIGDDVIFENEGSAARKIDLVGAIKIKFSRIS